MIDFHSHILPCVDDGSKSVSESLELLKMLKEQGVSKVVATPHFYANHNSVEKFLERRKISYESLKPSITDDLPKISLGAEVKYYEGISRLDNLSKLCVEGTKLLLLEMTMRKWTAYTLRELTELASQGRVTVVLAHIERYLRFQPSDLIYELVDSGILIQSNADFFLSFGSRHKAISMLKYNLIHFIGSDCHDLVHRPPKMLDASSYIKRKAGEDLLLQMNHFAETFFIN